ncbi:hypothetical protein C8Q76DRAFT_791323 [Earliella scabrosa]|nr:hypothetical protein C8Q76DRAFT_791323 [Earliella scabrosa]
MSYPIPRARGLRAIVSLENYPLLLREFICYADYMDDDLAADGMPVIANVIMQSDAIATLVMKSFIQIRLQQRLNAIASGALPPQSLSPAPLCRLVSKLSRE